MLLNSSSRVLLTATKLKPLIMSGGPTAMRLTVSSLFVQASSCYGLWSCCGNLYVKLVHLKSSFRVSWALKHACATSPVNYCVILKRHIPYRCCHDTEVVPVCGLQHILTVQTQPRHRPGDRYFAGGVSALGKPKRLSAWIISCVWLCTPST